MFARLVVEQGYYSVFTVVNPFKWIAIYVDTHRSVCSYIHATCTALYHSLPLLATTYYLCQQNK